MRRTSPSRCSTASRRRGRSGATWLPMRSSASAWIPIVRTRATRDSGGLAAAFVDQERVVLVPVVVLVDFVVVPTRLVVVGDIGQRPFALAEQAVVKPLLQLARFTKATGTSLPGHGFTYLVCRPRGGGLWACDGPIPPGTSDPHYLKSSGWWRPRRRTRLLGLRDPAIAGRLRGGSGRRVPVPDDRAVVGDGGDLLGEPGRDRRPERGARVVGLERDLEAHDGAELLAPGGPAAGPAPEEIRTARPTGAARTGEGHVELEPALPEALAEDGLRIGERVHPFRELLHPLGDVGVFALEREQALLEGAQPL